MHIKTELISYNQCMNPEQFKAALKQCGWTQKNLAGRLGLNTDTVSLWATGKSPVPGYVVEYMRVLELARQIVGKPAKGGDHGPV